MQQPTDTIVLILVGFSRPQRPRYPDAHLPDGILLLDSRQAENLTRANYPKAKKVLMQAGLSNPLIAHLQREFGCYVAMLIRNRLQLVLQANQVDPAFSQQINRFFAEWPMRYRRTPPPSKSYTAIMYIRRL